MAIGRKTGGKQKGTLNKATQVRMMVEESLQTPAGREALARAMQQLTAPPTGQKKAVEVLREMMMLSAALVSLHQPKRDQATGTVTVENHEKLQAYLGIAVRAAAEVAKYESPTFKAVAVQEVPPLPQAPPGAEATNVASSIGKRSQKDAMAVYMRVVRGAKAG